jgi:hypothetical protein
VIDPRTLPAFPALILVVLVAAVSTACGESDPRVALYTDSLGAQARPHFEAQLRGEARVRGVTVAGAALCDALDQIAADAERRTPRLALLQFSGNNVTECMQGPDGAPLEGDALVDKYEADARRAAQILLDADVAVYFAGSPPTAITDASVRINDRYRRITEELSGQGRDITFIEAQGSVTGPDGGYVETLPCLAFETPAMGCQDGEIQVRAPDGVHFCPEVTGEDPGCPVWSSGAYRFGSALAEPVLDELAGTTTTTPAARG